jgi:CheY-like chemotaxis protein
MSPEATIVDRPVHEETASLVRKLRAGRIVLAEDDREMRELLAWALRRDGYEVVQAENGMELLDRVAASHESGMPIDLVIADVRMPGVTGLEALDWLREAGCDEPVILITAFGDASTHQDATRLGAWAVLDKPFEIGTFWPSCTVCRSGISSRRETSDRAP